MVQLWSLGGLSLWQLLRRTARESWEDSVFGQGGRMAFYQFLAIFPSLLVLMVVVAPHAGDSSKRLLQDLSGRVLPSQGAHVLTNFVDQLAGREVSGFQLILVCGGALWASCNATWAMIYGLNRAFEVKEHRPHWQLALTIGGLTLSLALMSGIALFLLFADADVHARWHMGVVLFRGLEWLVLLVALCFWFVLLYRFAPNLRTHEWRSSTPGAACALVLWLGATFAAHIYFERVNDYSRAYGHLNGVAVLLLWLYVTNGAILIGGEMNSEIQKAERNTSG